MLRLEEELKTGTASTAAVIGWMHAFTRATGCNPCLTTAHECCTPLLVRVVAMLLQTGADSHLSSPSSPAQQLLDLLVHGPLNAMRIHSTERTPGATPVLFQAAGCGDNADSACMPPLCVQAFQMVLFVLQQPLGLSGGAWSSRRHGQAVMDCLTRCFEALGGTTAQLSACVLAWLRGALSVASPARNKATLPQAIDTIREQAEVQAAWLGSASCKRVLGTLARIPGVSSLLVALLFLTGGHETRDAGACVMRVSSFFP
jgi:hypothetical protein